MLDRVIINGSVIDGTGSPARETDIGIQDGRIVQIGPISEKAKDTIDAKGCVVAPGFVDLHTHFDAQVFWDPDLTPVSLHGVTTVAGGNCGFTVAPLSDESGPYLMRMLSRVEGMPLEMLEQGVPCTWRSFGEYLDTLEGKLGLNVGFMVGHSAIRRAVMGESAVGKKATADQVAAMQKLLGESLASGGLGFSSTMSPTHNDLDGQPVPSRWADKGEILALCRTVRDHPGTTLEFIPGAGAFSDAEIDLMAEMSLCANRPLNWNVLVVSSFAPAGWKAQLAASDHAASRGGRVVALTPSQVTRLRLNLRSGFVWDVFPGWPEVLALPIEKRMEALRDPAVRERMLEGSRSSSAGPLRVMGIWENMEIAECFSEKNKALEGRRLGDVAKERGQEPFDALVDISLEEGLRTSFAPFIPGDDEASWQQRKEVWLDPRTIIGASDAGAHLDMIDTFSCTTSLLGPGVRDKGLITLEQAVEQLTDVPARHYGMKKRGRIAEGYHADITIFDPDRVGPGPVYSRADLPAGESRLYAEAEGIEHVLVSGVPIVHGKELTGARPGAVLRSGRDTETVTVPGGASYPAP